MNVTKRFPGFASFSLAGIVALISFTAASAPPAKDAKKAEPKKAVTNSEPVATLSVFSIPTNPKEGRDPFFPASTRPYVTFQPLKPGVKPPVIEYPLTLTGIIPNKLIMVNGRTFSEGEEGDIIINGVRKKIRCLKVKEESGIIELLPEGERRELKMRFGANP